MQAVASGRELVELEQRRGSGCWSSVGRRGAGAAMGWYGAGAALGWRRAGAALGLEWRRCSVELEQCWCGVAGSWFGRQRGLWSAAESWSQCGA